MQSEKSDMSVTRGCLYGALQCIKGVPKFCGVEGSDHDIVQHMEPHMHVNLNIGLHVMVSLREIIFSLSEGNNHGNMIITLLFKHGYLKSVVVSWHCICF
jgi:hypothetical protein